MDRIKNALLSLGAGLAAASFASAASACVVIPFVLDVGATEAPVVCENIFRLGTNFDYQFFVKSAGPASIDYFGFGVGAGVFPGINPANGQLPTFTNGGPTAFPNISVTGTLPVTAQFNAVFSSNIVGGPAIPTGWAFDHYTPATLGGAAGYWVDWNDLGTTVQPGDPRLRINNNLGSIAANGIDIGVFEALSPFGPGPGLAANDPMAIEFGHFLGDPGLDNIWQESVDSAPPPNQALCKPAGSPGDLPDCTDPNGNKVNPHIPEPGTLSLLAVSLLGLAATTRRRTTSRVS